MFRIEKMNDENVRGVAELEKENFSDGWSLDSLKEEINNPNAFYLVAVDEDTNEVAASGGLIISYDSADIMNVSVNEKYRRQSLAFKLLSELIDEGRRMGIKEFTLEVRENNAPARALYEKLGFKFEGIRPNFYTKPVEGAAIYWLR